MTGWPQSKIPVTTSCPRRVPRDNSSRARVRACFAGRAGQEIEEKPDESILGYQLPRRIARRGFPAFAHLLSGLPPTWFPCSSLEFQPPHVANRTSRRRRRRRDALPRRENQICDSAPRRNFSRGLSGPSPSRRRAAHRAAGWRVTREPCNSRPKTRLATRFRREQGRNNFSIPTWPARTTPAISAVQTGGSCYLRNIGT